jgi:hypothetical protein
MEDLENILLYIEKNNNIVNMFNIFIKFDKKQYLNIFKNFVERIQYIKTFNDCGQYLNNSYTKYKHLITYLKCYIVINNINKDYIIFNNSLFENLEDIDNKEDNKDNYNTCNYGNDAYTNEENTLIFKIEDKSKNTKKLINYLINYNNFISNFILKRNKKTILLSSLWKNEIFKYSLNNNQINMNKFNYKKNFDTKIYKETNKKYKIQKFRKIEFIINKEIIISSIRLALPNSFSISLIDNTYICLNKIIMSEKLQLGEYIFKNIREKVYFIFNLYKEFFGIDINTLNFITNISLKIKNTDNIIYLNNIQATPIENICFTNEYIILKYINSYKKLIEIHNTIENYKKKYKKYFKYFNEIKINILYLPDTDIDKFFSNK